MSTPLLPIISAITPTSVALTWAQETAGVGPYTYDVRYIQRALLHKSALYSHGWDLSWSTAAAGVPDSARAAVLPINVVEVDLDSYYSIFLVSHDAMGVTRNGFAIDVFVPVPPTPPPAGPLRPVIRTITSASIGIVWAEEPAGVGPYTYEVRYVQQGRDGWGAWQTAAAGVPDTSRTVVLAIEAVDFFYSILLVSHDATGTAREGLLVDVFAPAPHPLPPGAPIP